MTLFPALKFSHLVPTKYVYLNRLLTIAIQKKTAYNEVVGNIVCVGQSELPFGWLFFIQQTYHVEFKNTRYDMHIVAVIEYLNYHKNKGTDQRIYS